MTLTVGAFEAKTQLSKLLELVRKGERVIITKHGVPVAELTAPVALRAAAPSNVAAQLKAIRRRTKSGPDTVKSMIEDGRRH
ncbi:MAG: type II toxin-antitoxin system prevent-host-death family antitoxin [Syntrophobacteraceae bacterium]|jgi:prevent-host-death family protein